MKKYKLIISERAINDLNDIWLYIAAVNSVNSDIVDKFLDLLYAKCEILCGMPESGRMRDELLQGVRSLVVKKYVIFYRIKGYTVEVVSILNEFRDMDSIF